MHSFGDFSAVVPKAIGAYCDSVRVRFARSSRLFLLELHKEAMKALGNDLGICDLTLNKLPKGCMRDHSLVDGLLDSIKLRGHFSVYRDRLTVEDPGCWVLDDASTPPKGSSVQSACFDCFAVLEREQDLARSYAKKLSITVGESFANPFLLPADWLVHVRATLLHTREHVKMCLFKTWVGGWTTSVRTHEPVCMQCLFGCIDAKDDLRHYIECAPLWHLAGEALKVQPPLDLRERLGILNPSVERFTLLALAFQGYHYAKSRCEGIGGSRLIVQDSRVMQRSVQEALRTYAHNFA